MFLPNTKIKRCLIFIALVFIIYYYYYYSASYSDAVKKEEIVLPLNVSGETSIAPEDVGIHEMDEYLIKFKDYRLKFHIKSEKRDLCKSKLLLIIIPSRPQNFRQREDIRNTWLRNLPSEVIYRFIIGYTSNSTIRIGNRNESSIFNDLIITDLEDTYYNLTLKTYAFFQWQQVNCPEVGFILKADDDSAVNVRKMLYWIKEDFEIAAEKYQQKVIFGFVMYFNPPYRIASSKWYIPPYAWPHRYFPSYCNGPSYILTSAAIESILFQAPNFYFITVEDALFTGILAEAAGAQRIDRRRMFSIRFRNYSSYYGCDGNGVPYLTTVYHIAADKFDREEDKQNPMKAATQVLQDSECPNFLISWLYWFWRYL